MFLFVLGFKFNPEARKDWQKTPIPKSKYCTDSSGNKKKDGGKASAVVFEFSSI
jgi:hypothetical protein